MSDYDLCSAVFILRPQRVLATQHRFLGRMAQKLFLLMLNQADYEALAKKLHSLNTGLPYTVSDLFMNGRDHTWMRVTGLNPELCHAIQHLVDRLPGQILEVPSRDSVDEAAWTVRVEAAVMSQHEWAGNATYSSFVQRAWMKPADNRLTLDFMTPTALKSVGVYRPFPQPTLAFRLLYERWLKLNAAPLPFQPELAYLEAFTDYLIEIADYEIACASTPQKSGQTTTFYGWITYHLLSGNDDFRKRAETQQTKRGDTSLLLIYEDIRKQREQYASLVHLLATFAFYSALGSYTGQGMGMVRKVERNGR
jgi:CRISPR/Cas system endoribonuclease Cas6 (RAMP superfamily)